MEMTRIDETLTVKKTLEELLKKNRLPPIDKDDQPSGIPSNYAQLLAAAVRKEQEDLIVALNEIISAHDDLDVIRGLTRALFAQCEKSNYLALHEGVSNQLCWEVAKILFNPPHFGAMVKILFADVDCLEISYELKPKTERTPTLTSRKQLNVTRKPLDTLSSYPVDSSLLAKVIVGDGAILMVDTVNELTLNLHQQLYDQLVQHYPNICTDLYKHNSDFKQLFMDMQRGQVTPGEMIRRFAYELARAGTRFTGLEYAAGSVAGPYEILREYINGLPQELRKAVLNLKYKEGEEANRFKDIIIHLGECVEIGASRFQAILANPENAEVLNTIPRASAEELDAIKRHYCKNPMNTRGEGREYVIPSTLQDVLIGRIKITSLYDYIDLLINIPSEKYDLLFRFASITCDPHLPLYLPEALVALSQEQRSAFFSAIMKYQKKFGDDDEILCLMIESGDIHAIEKFLKSRSEEEKFTLLCNKQIKNSGDAEPYLKTLLHLASKAQSPDVFRVCMASLSKTSQQRVINMNEMLALVTEYYSYAYWNIIWDICSEYPQDVREKIISDNELLHAAMNNGDERIYETLLAVYPKEKQRLALRQKYEFNRTNLHTASVKGKFRTVEFILKCLPQDERWGALLELDENGNSCLLDLLRYNRTLPFDGFFAFVSPTTNWFDALQLKVTHDQSLLHIMVHYASFAVWSNSWNLLTDEEKRQAANIKDKYGNRLLNQVILHETFDSIWNVLSDDVKSSSLKHRNNKGQTLLHQLFLHVVGYSPEFFEYILKLYLSIDNHWKILLEKDSEGNSFIMAATKAINLSAVAHAVVQSSSRMNCSDLLLASNNQSQTILHLAAWHLDFELWQTLWSALLPDEQQAAFERRCSNDSTILHYAACNGDPRIFDSLWQQLTMQSKEAKLDDASKNGLIYLDWALLYGMKNTKYKTYMAILKHYPQDLQFSALMRNARKSDFAKSDEIALHRLAVHSEFKEWVQFWGEFSPEQKAHALQIKDSNGSTVLHYAACNADPMVFGSLWSPLLANETSKDGNNYLHWAAQHTRLLTYLKILSYYPESERLSVILAKNSERKMTLDLMERSVTFIKESILLLLPKEDHLRLRDALLSAAASPSTQGMFAQNAPPIATQGEDAAAVVQLTGGPSLS